MRRLVLVVCSLLLCVAIVGVGYALWSETLWVDGTVHTGIVDWGFQYCTLLDEFPPPPMSGPGTIGDWTCDPGFLNVHRLQKNVAWGSATIVDNGHAVDFQLDNVYPCYFNALNLYPVNTGTIPIHIERVKIKDGAGNVVAELTESPAPIVNVDLNGDGAADVEILWGDNFGAQLHPGDPPVEISMSIHVLQPCPEDADLKFTIELEAVQWNESIHPYVP